MLGGSFTMKWKERRKVGRKIEGNGTGKMDEKR